MSKRLLPALILQCIRTILCILISVSASHGVADQYANCSIRRYYCGTRSLYIGYPFWGAIENDFRFKYCGRVGFELNCFSSRNVISIEMVDREFQVLSIDDRQQTMTIAFDPDDFFSYCSSLQEWKKPIINRSLLSYSENVRNLSLFFNCSGALSSLGKNKFNCYSLDGDRNGFYTIDDDSRLQNRTDSCHSVIKVPIQLSPENFDYLTAGDLKEVIKKGFEVKYRAADSESCSACSSSQGICGSNESSDEFVCLCRDKHHSLTCPTGMSSRVKLVVGLVAGIFGLTIACIIIRIFMWKKISSILSTACCRKITKRDKDLEAFIRNYGPLSLKRYKFSDVMKMTNSFKDKLGQGGFGGVYKGKLLNGCFVAVKLLNASKGDGQDFINEVASISRTSHVNIVTLLGFCLEGDKRALIYEFMPNGSLEKFTYKGDTSKPCQYLRWEKMNQIVIGIARGLEYLHRGCNTRILHFDIKPHNILLDDDFCPKISDFGLAKLYPTKESIVSSLLGARGTIGYIAPEVFSRNFGEVSHKSDVYSFGMMIMELVGCKNNQDSGVENSTDVYFPHWIYRHVQQDREFKLPGVVTRKENEIAKKMIIVGLWCIQARPRDRPSMNEVIEMVQGSIEALQIPPTPFLSSPPRPTINSSAISTSCLNDLN